MAIFEVKFLIMEVVLQSNDRLIPVKYEEYHDSSLFGWSFARYGIINLPYCLPLEEVYEIFKNTVDIRNEYQSITLTICTSLSQHLTDTCLLPLCTYCCCCRLCLCLCCPFLFEKKGLYLSSGRSNISGTVGEVLLDQGTYLRYYRPRFKRGQHDIGVWTTKLDFIGSSLLYKTKGYSYLTSMNFTLNSTDLADVFSDCNSLISKVIESNHGDHYAKYHLGFCSPDILQKLQILRNIVDESYQTALCKKPLTECEDFKYHMSLPELENVLGQTITSSLLHYFIHETFSHSSPNKLYPYRSRHVDQIILRRTSLHDQCIPFHTDVALRTMQILLNSSDEYGGGRLVYLSENNCIIPKRLTGTILIHENNIVHGVTEMECGVRYGLFFLQKQP